MQNERFDQLDDVSTNGVNIAKVTLSQSFNILSKLAGEERKAVRFAVWDFGGQAVFHSTHRFFITPNALYLVLYDMTKIETNDRVKYVGCAFFFYCLFLVYRYWLEQIGSYEDLTKTKPVIIVGTHADLLSKQDRARIDTEMQLLYPTPALSSSLNRYQIQGHFSIGLSEGEKGGLSQLKKELINLALSHPKIGVGKVMVPKSFDMISYTLEKMSKEHPFIKWSVFSALGSELGM